MLIVASAALALPTITQVKVDSTTVQEGQTNRLSIESGDEFDVQVWFDSSAEESNLRVDAQITGYEHDDDYEIRDKTSLFDVEANATYKKTLSLRLPSDVDTDSYKLRVSVYDRNSDELVQNYNLLLDRPRHSVTIEDVVFYPEGTVTAGNMLLSTVRLENLGQKDEDDVKVRVSIPELGLSATDYIEEIDNDDEEETEEMFMRIPASAAAGEYTVNVVVDYNDGYDTVSDSYTISVEEARTVSVVTEPVEPTEPTVEDNGKSALRSVLEGLLLVLVGILVIVAIIFGVSKLSSKDE
jgi:hypothetical protein